MVRQLIQEMARPLIEVAQECLFVLSGEKGCHIKECMDKLADYGIGTGTDDDSLMGRIMAAAKTLKVATHVSVPEEVSIEEPGEQSLPVGSKKRQRDVTKHGLFQFGLTATTGKTSQGFVPSNKKAAPIATVSDKDAVSPPSSLAIYSCDLCGKTCQTHPALISHGKIHSPNAKPRSTPFTAPDSAPPAEEDEAGQLVSKILKEVLNTVFFTILRNERLQKEEEAKRDGRKDNHSGGAKKRKRYEVGVKAKCIDLYDSLVNTQGTTHGALGIVEADEGLNQGTLGKWLKDRKNILEAAGVKRRGALKKVGSKKRDPRTMGKFPKAELVLYDLFRKRRRKMRRASDRWLRKNARQLVMKIYGSDDSLGAAALVFKACKSWRVRFAIRFHLSPRRRTNKKITPLVERIVKWRAYHRRLRRFISLQENDSTKAASGGFIAAVLADPIGLGLLPKTTDGAGAKWGMKVAKVKPGGSALSEGIKVGDQLVMMGNKVVKDETFSALSQLLTDAEGPVAFVFKRVASTQRAAVENEAEADEAVLVRGERGHGGGGGGGAQQQAGGQEDDADGDVFFLGVGEGQGGAAQQQRGEQQQQGEVEAVCPDRKTSFEGWLAFRKQEWRGLIARRKQEVQQQAGAGALLGGGEGQGGAVQQQPVSLEGGTENGTVESHEGGPHAAMLAAGDEDAEDPTQGPLDTDELDEIDDYVLQSEECLDLGEVDESGSDGAGAGEIDEGSDGETSDEVMISWSEAVVRAGLTAVQTSSLPPKDRALCKLDIAYNEEDCGWFVGTVVRKAHGTGHNSYLVKFDEDENETRTLSPDFYLSTEHHLLDTQDGAPPGSWCVVSLS